VLEEYPQFDQVNTVALKLGLSRTQVLRLRVANGYSNQTPRDLSKIRQHCIKAALLEGFIEIQIAEVLGVSREYVRQIKTRLPGLEVS
jgi:DNA-directed RNA polymerase specialized sigma subunit